MASVLFLAPTDLGETVFATGALAHVLGEGGELTVLTGSDARPLFRSAPGLKAQYTIEGIRDVGRFIELAWSRRARRFDLMLDLRRTPAALMLPAKHKLILPATRSAAPFFRRLERPRWQRPPAGADNLGLLNGEQAAQENGG